MQTLTHISTILLFKLRIVKASYVETVKKLVWGNDTRVSRTVNCWPFMFLPAVRTRPPFFCEAESTIMRHASA